MPTYEYRCKACSQELEVVQSFTDDALTTCEACGGQLRKLFGNVGIAFKGTGFYKNDSRDKPKSAASTGDKGGADKGTSDAGGDKGGGDKGGGGDQAASSTGSSGSKDTGSGTKTDTKNATPAKKKKDTASSSTKGA